MKILQKVIGEGDFQSICDRFSSGTKITRLNDLTGWLATGTPVLQATKLRVVFPGLAERYALEVLEMLPNEGRRYVTLSVMEDFDGEAAMALYKKFRDEARKT